MKKAISIFLCAVLLFSMCMSLTGCNSDAKSIIGKWTAEINYAAAVNAGIHTSEGMKDIDDYFNFDEFYLTTTFTFFEDGTLTVSSLKDGVIQQSIYGYFHINSDLFAV